MNIKGYDLQLTCESYPEQYDVLKAGKKVGYLRLRNGRFRADYPESGGETVFEAIPEGDGYFRDDERDYYLTKAIDAIDKRISNREGK